MSQNGDQINPFGGPYRPNVIRQKGASESAHTNKNESFRRKVNEKSEFTEKVDVEISCFTDSVGGNQLEDGGETPMEKAVLVMKEEFKCQQMLKETRQLFEWSYLFVLGGTLTQHSSLFSFVSVSFQAKFLSRMLSEFLQICSSVNSTSES